eukprot:tig00000093_g3585.t1
MEKPKCKVLRVCPPDVELQADDAAGPVFHSLQEAVDAAAVDAVIEVHPGEYAGPVRLNVPGLVLRGATGGGPKPVLLAFDGPHVLRAEAPCVVRGLSIGHDSQLPGAAVELAAGAEAAELLDCDVAAACVGVAVRAPGATLRGCVVHGGVAAGVEVRAPGATVRDCEFFGFLKSGVEVVGADATIEGNVFRDLEVACYYAEAGGAFSSNVLLECRFGCWLAGGAAPSVSENIFRRCRTAIFVTDDAVGRVSENRVEGFGGDGQDATGVLVSGDADPEVVENEISACEFGLMVREGARGRFCRNRIQACATGVCVAMLAVPLCAENEVLECRDLEHAVLVSDHARGVFAGNNVHSNRGNGFLVRSGAEPFLRGNKIRGNARSGVLVHSAGRPVLEANFIEGNDFHGVQVIMDGLAILEENRISDSGHHGVYVHTGGAASLARNEIEGCGGAAVAAGNLGTVQVDRGTRAADTDRLGMGLEGYAVFDTGSIDVQ